VSRNESSGRSPQERQLALIHQIARIATGAGALRDKLQQIVEVLQRHLDCEFVACASIDHRVNGFVCEAVASTVPTMIHVGYGRELGSGVVGDVAASGGILYVPDVTRHANYVETMSGTRSELCVAVRHHDEVMGVLNAESRHTDAFADDVDLLETVAEQVAGVFAASRLDEAQRGRVELLGMLSELLRAAVEANDLAQTLHRIVVYLREKFDLESCAVLLTHGEDQQLRIDAHAGTSVFHGRSGGSWPTSVGVIGRALRSGEAQYVPDVTVDADYVLGNPAVGAELVLPIRFHGRLLCLLNFESTGSEAFSEVVRQMLAALAEQVAGAIHLAMTNDRLRETNRLVEEKSAALAQANQRLREANAQLERLSHLDGLTGIPNRRRFDEALFTEWRRAVRHRHALGMAMLDIDAFKAFNDGYGHIAGDDALRRVARALASSLNRAEDLVARYGGEEFAVLLPEADIDEAERCARHLHAVIGALELPHAFAEHSKTLTISVGFVSVMPSELLSQEILIERADRALYRAKAAGRNRIARDDTPTDDA
jgi:diguanylate cyclase (GGDEF)-like protein